jgi:hypothetical protein
MDNADKTFFIIMGLAVLGLIVSMFNPVQEQPASNQDLFQVVDSYRGCDIIRYTDQSNRWHYLMKCND